MYIQFMNLINYLNTNSFRLNKLPNQFISNYQFRNFCASLFASILFPYDCLLKIFVSLILFETITIYWWGWGWGWGWGIKIVVQTDLMYSCAYLGIIFVVTQFIILLGYYV